MITFGLVRNTETSLHRPFSVFLPSPSVCEAFLGISSGQSQLSVGEGDLTLPSGYSHVAVMQFQCGVVFDPKLLSSPPQGKSFLYISVNHLNDARCVSVMQMQTQFYSKCTVDKKATWSKWSIRGSTGLLIYFYCNTT